MDGGPPTATSLGSDGLIGNELLLLPCVAVLPRDREGRILLVRHGSTGLWGLVGGAVDVGESPAEAAVREMREEVSLDLKVGPVVAAVGGPEYEFTYPNGNRCAYVAVLYEAQVDGQEPVADGDEVVETRWVSPADLQSLDLNTFARALLREVGHLAG